MRVITRQCLAFAVNIELVVEVLALSFVSHEVIEAAMRTALIEEMGLKPRVAFGPVRIAITGSHISPPLFESMEILGRVRCLARLSAI